MNYIQDFIIQNIVYLCYHFAYYNNTFLNRQVAVCTKFTFWTYTIYKIFEP